MFFFFIFFFKEKKEKKRKKEKKKKEKKKKKKKEKKEKKKKVGKKSRGGNTVGRLDQADVTTISLRKRQLYATILVAHYHSPSSGGPQTVCGRIDSARLC